MTRGLLIKAGGGTAGRTGPDGRPSLVGLGDGDEPGHVGAGDDGVEKNKEPRR